jgi:hypothetical protein
MDNILKPIRQFVLHIRSKDVERFGDLNSHLFIDLTEPILVDSKTEEIHQVVLSGEIPNSFYNVSSDLKNNIIRFTANGEPLPFTFPNKNYDINEIVKVLNDGNFPFTVSYDRFTMKLTFANNTNFTNILNLSTSNANKILGFDENDADITLTPGQSTTSTGVVDLASVHSIFIKSNSSSNMIFSTRAGFSSTIQKISIDVNSGGIIYLNQNDSRQHTVLNNNIEFIELRLTDQNNNLINFNNINYEITMAFYIYSKNKIIRTQNLSIRQNRNQVLTTNNNQTNMRPFDSSFQIQPIPEEEEVVNTVTPIEHKGNRLIIDDVLEEMQNT